MPQTINFPDSFDDDNSLYIVVNNKRTQLASSITDTATTIPVLTTSGFPDVGFLTILSGPDITQAEAIAYSGTDSTNFFNAERGVDGTPASAHASNAFVDHTIVSRHHNNLKDSVIELEHFVGISGSPNFIRTDATTITAPTGTFTDSLTVSGSPVSIGGGGASLTVRETDGTPTVNNVNTIVVTTGTLTDDGGGQVTILTGGGGGGGGGAAADEGAIVFLSQVFS